MKTIAFPLIFISFAGLMTACSLLGEDLFGSAAPPTFQETINIGKNRISCDYCWGFGNTIEIVGDEIFVGGNGSVRIFEYLSGNITLKQTIDYGKKSSGIKTIVGHNNILAIGHADYFGTGTVYMYEKQANTWILKQTITQAVSQDNFGSAIDFDDQWMVIGANAPWMDANYSNSKPGKAYIYALDHGTWRHHKTLESQAPSGGARFGQTVALIKNRIMVGGMTGSNQNYELINNTWTFVSAEPSQWIKIAHDKDLFLSVSSYDNKYSAWRLRDDGTKSELAGSIDFKNLSSPIIGDLCEVKGEHVLLTNRNVYQSFLFKLNNSELILEEAFKQNAGEQIQFEGLAIGDHFMALGGRNDASRDGKDVNMVIIKPR